MMRRLYLLLTAAVLLSAGCLSEPAETATLALPPGASSTTDDGASSTTAADSDTATETTTTDHPCVVDEDCDDVEICHEGACTFPCGAPYDPGLAAAPLGARTSQAIIEVDTPRVVFIVDKSGTMGSEPFDDDGDPQTAATTRWAGLHAALSGFLEANAALHAGLVLAPSLEAVPEYNAGACLIEPVPYVKAQRYGAYAILDALPPADATSPAIAGATPTRAAIEAAHAHLAEVDPSHARVIVLLTDGAANCAAEAVEPTELFEVYDEAVVDAVADASAAGIPTHVIALDVADAPTPAELDGLPDGVNLYAALSELAVAGGTELANAGDGPALAAALAELAPIIIPCAAAVPAGLLDLDLVVSVGASTYDEIAPEDCATADGWSRAGDVDEDEGTETMLLCGQACADLRSSGEISFYPALPWPC
ncbi:MAG: VWA domain-containing protein [Myxococcales bacterium]|nr:VWA domain-containing protein [Myxococcales bacterium]